jgi:hypothetical protein
MNTINLLGFTAENSLGKENNRYLRQEHRPQPGAQMLIPQELKCSDDGRLCLDCHYDTQGRLVYCDVIFLPPVRRLARF